jgi:hypothetical protein
MFGICSLMRLMGGHISPQELRTENKEKAINVGCSSQSTGSSSQFYLDDAELHSKIFHAKSEFFRAWGLIGCNLVFLRILEVNIVPYESIIPIPCEVQRCMRIPSGKVLWLK